MLSGNQCDQMFGFSAQYFAIYNYVICPKSKLNVSKKVENFPKYKLNPHKVAEYANFFAKVAKFRQIWSHWWQLMFT